MTYDTPIVDYLVITMLLHINGLIICTPEIGCMVI